MRQEAALRVALDEAGAVVRDAPEARAHHAKVMRPIDALFDAALPHATPADRALAADLLMTTMKAVAERITAEGRSRADVESFAEASADMLSGYLERQAGRRSGACADRLDRKRPLAR